jgi:hypothetical protein
MGFDYVPFKSNLNQFHYKMSGHYPSYKVKAGRFTFDSETKKVRVCKDKGLLSFYTVLSGRVRMQSRKTI